MSRNSTNEDIFAKLALGTAKKTEEALVLSRHLDAAGHLIAMPRKKANRLILLQHFAAGIEPGEDHEETAVNARLRQFSDDVAMLRRYLVDEGLLERRPPGIYRRTVNERATSE